MNRSRPRLRLAPTSGAVAHDVFATPYAPLTTARAAEDRP